MAEVPSFADWKKATYSLTRKRSDFLKVVDAAVQAYEGSKSAAAKEKIKVALDRWRFEQSKQGKDWKKSVRNEKGAVTNLHRAVCDLDKRNLSKEELEALQYISRTQSMALQNQFKEKKLTFKGTTLVGMANSAGSNWQRFKTGAKGVHSGGTQIKGLVQTGQSIKSGADLLRAGGKAAAFGAAQSNAAGNVQGIKKLITQFCGELCPGMDPNKVFAALKLGNVEQFATDLAPFVGAISAGGKAVAGWIGVAKAGYAKHDVAGRRFAIAAEDPEAAFDALLSLLNRELASQTAKASVATVAFTGKLAGSFADAGAVTGPVIGLLETLANIFQTVIEYVRDYKETEVANEMLRVGALNLELFEASPILGCYFLVVQDHSTIINFAVGDYGTVNWMFDVERLIKKIDPVLAKSQQFIQASRLEIVGLMGAKGVVEQNWAVKGKKDKILGLPGHVKDSISDRVDAWFEKPEKPPKVDKSRIVGFGST